MSMVFLPFLPHNGGKPLKEYKVDQGTSVIGMDAAGTPGPTAGTGLKFRVESLHKGIKEGF